MINTNNISSAPSGALLDNSAISQQEWYTKYEQHLEILGYQGKKDSFRRCGEVHGSYIQIPCTPGCTEHMKKIPLQHHCNLRVCSGDGRQRKNRFRKLYTPLLEPLPITTVRNPFREGLKFWTISPQNVDDLLLGIINIRKDFVNYQRRRYNKEERIGDRVISGLYVIEAKRSYKGEPYYRNGKIAGYHTETSWNVHIHALIYSRYLDNQVRQAGKDSKIVSIWKQMTHKGVTIRIEPINSKSALLNYMLKYVSSQKEDMKTPEDYAVFVKATYKRQLVTTFGKHFSKEARLKARYWIDIKKMLCPICYGEKGRPIFVDPNAILEYEEITGKKSFYDYQPPPFYEGYLCNKDYYQFSYGFISIYPKT